MTEQQPYDLVRTTPGFELRRYPEHVVAETVVTGVSGEDAGSRAFRSLFGYITGETTARQSIEMTAPVVQSRSERIAMTAPVVQETQGDGFVVAFVLPATMEGLRAVGEPRFARFHPPYTPWFVRRNEVLVDVLEEA
mgnify:CR=1 FL=1